MYLKTNKLRITFITKVGADILLVKQNCAVAFSTQQNPISVRFVSNVEKLNKL